MDVQIREAAEEDVSGICSLLVDVNDLHAKALPHRFRRIEADDRTADFLRSQIAQEDRQLFVAVRGGELGGFVSVRLHQAPDIPVLTPRRYAEIDTLVVSSPLRRQGLGQALVHRAHRWAGEQGIDQVELAVYEFNAEAIALYEKLGYITVRRTMWRSLPASSSTG